MLFRSQMLNTAAAQQNFENLMRRAQGIAGAQNQKAMTHLYNAGQTGEMWQGMGEGLGEVAGALGAKFGGPKKPAGNKPSAGRMAQPTAATGPNLGMNYSQPASSFFGVKANPLE